MKPIPIRSYPLERTYKTAEAAIAGAENHPLQPEARSGTCLLEGSSLVDAFWTDSAFAIKFSNGKWLHVFMEEHRPRWSIVGVEPCLGKVVKRVGAPAVLLDWGREAGPSVMDRSKLISQRRGKDFWMLFVNECGLLVYVKRMLILVFHPVFRTDTCEDMLYVAEYD